ncbi:MAG: nucleotidyltransferase [Pirellulaceae bacterium]
MTPNLVIQTLNRTWCELNKNDLSSTLVGGLALPVWNYPRSTQDIDLLLFVTDDRRLLTLCESMGCRPRRQPVITELGNIRVLQTEIRLPDEYLEIDIDFLLGHSDFHASVVSRAVAIDYPGVTSKIRVATCEDLILLKLQSSRLVDLADSQRLIELNPELDWGYLNEWARQLSVEELLDRAKAQ